MRRASHGRRAAVLVAFCFAAPAWADFSERDPEVRDRGRPDAPDPRRLELRLGISFGWLLYAANGPPQTAGLLPLELGVGYRLTDNLSMGLFTRAGLIHAGAGVEAVFLPGGTWSRDSVGLRLAGIAVRDGLTCIRVDGEDPPPCKAVYALAEVGLQYHLVAGRGLSVELALQVGSQRKTDGASTTSRLVFGVIGPRFVSEF